jgi:lipoprotein-releasing system ATP-binding protein
MAKSSTETKTTSHGPVLLSARGVGKDYDDGGRTLHVLKDVNLEIHRAESVSIIGRSGSGKSTLLHLLGALDRPTTGTVEFDGANLSNLADRQLAELRAKRVGFIYQFHHLLPEFTALENVLLPGMILGGKHSGLVARAENLLERVGLKERMLHRPAKLSGGERQRVALARALMNDPDVVLADEPTGDLDQATGQEVLAVVLEHTVAAGKSLVLVTHDLALAAKAASGFKLEKGVLTRER